MECSPPPSEVDLGQVALSPRVVEQQPPDAAAQLQAQLVKTLRGALEEMRAMHRRSEKARKRERGQLQERIQELTGREERRISEIAELRAQTAELEAKLLGGSNPDGLTRRAPSNTEIQVDPLPEYPADNSSDPRDWFIYLGTKGDFPGREDEWKVKTLPNISRIHDELLPLLSEPGRRYEKMRDQLRRQHPAYPLGCYKQKLDDLKAMWLNPAQMRGCLLKLQNLQKKMCEKLNIPNPVWDAETLRAAYLEAVPARMTHLVVECGDFTRLTLEQLQARAEALALGEHLQERKTSQSTASSPASILAVRKPRQVLGIQCFEWCSNGHWAKDCSCRVRNLQARRSVEPKTECKLCRMRGHDAQGCRFKCMGRCKRCHGFGHSCRVVGCR